jgi:hypothetical protein
MSQRELWWRVKTPARGLVQDDKLLGAAPRLMRCVLWEREVRRQNERQWHLRRSRSPFERPKELKKRERAAARLLNERKIAEKQAQENPRALALAVAALLRAQQAIEQPVSDEKAGEAQWLENVAAQIKAPISVVASCLIEDKERFGGWGKERKKQFPGARKTLRTTLGRKVAMITPHALARAGERLFGAVAAGGQALWSARRAARKNWGQSRGGAAAATSAAFFGMELAVRLAAKGDWSAVWAVEKEAGGLLPCSARAWEGEEGCDNWRAAIHGATQENLLRLARASWATPAWSLDARDERTHWAGKTGLSAAAWILSGGVHSEMGDSLAVAAIRMREGNEGVAEAWAEAIEMTQRKQVGGSDATHEERGDRVEKSARIVVRLLDAKPSRALVNYGAKKMEQRERAERLSMLFDQSAGAAYMSCDRLAATRRQASAAHEWAKPKKLEKTEEGCWELAWANAMGEGEQPDPQVWARAWQAAARRRAYARTDVRGFSLSPDAAERHRRMSEELSMLELWVFSFLAWGESFACESWMTADSVENGQERQAINRTVERFSLDRCASGALRFNDGEQRGAPQRKSARL